MLRRGEVASPAAVVINSGEKMNENPDLINAVQNARNRLLLRLGTRYGSAKAPGVFQYLNPTRSCFGPPPKNSTTPRMMRPMMAIIFKDANQNSASPYQETATILRIRMTGHWLENVDVCDQSSENIPTRITAIHTPTLTGDGQYSITRLAAVTSDTKSTENEYL